MQVRLRSGDFLWQSQAFCFFFFFRQMKSFVVLEVLRAVISLLHDEASLNYFGCIVLWFGRLTGYSIKLLFTLFRVMQLYTLKKLCYQCLGQRPLDTVHIGCTNACHVHVHEGHCYISEHKAGMIE